MALNSNFLNFAQTAAAAGAAAPAFPSATAGASQAERMAEEGITAEFLQQFGIDPTNPADFWSGATPGQGLQPKRELLPNIIPLLSEVVRTKDEIGTSDILARIFNKKYGAQTAQSMIDFFQVGTPGMDYLMSVLGGEIPFGRSTPELEHYIDFNREAGNNVDMRLITDVLYELAPVSTYNQNTAFKLGSMGVLNSFFPTEVGAASGLGALAFGDGGAYMRNFAAGLAPGMLRDGMMKTGLAIGSLMSLVGSPSVQTLNLGLLAALSSLHFGYKMYGSWAASADMTNVTEQDRMGMSMMNQMKNMIMSAKNIANADKKLLATNEQIRKNQGNATKTAVLAKQAENYILSIAKERLKDVLTNIFPNSEFTSSAMRKRALRRLPESRKLTERVGYPLSSPIGN